jgi:hypothetical protein
VSLSEENYVLEKDQIDGWNKFAKLHIALSKLTGVLCKAGIVLVIFGVIYFLFNSHLLKPWNCISKSNSPN